MMEFWDLQSFNVALPGKQAWHIISCLDSLVRRSYKAKYFHDSTILSMPLGHNPIFIWRSIWPTQSLMKVEIWRSIEVGYQTGVCNSPWLLEEQNHCIVTLPDTRITDIRVYELISRSAHV
ncbi:hypothetical protein LINGRAHAP2_LOCUS4666 [Linum grandiflorum]